MLTSMLLTAALLLPLPAPMWMPPPVLWSHPSDPVPTRFQDNAAKMELLTDGIAMGVCAFVDGERTFVVNVAIEDAEAPATVTIQCRDGKVVSVQHE